MHTKKSFVANSYKKNLHTFTEYKKKITEENYFGEPCRQAFQPIAVDLTKHSSWEIPEGLFLSNVFLHQSSPTIRPEQEIT